jgi:hypothetical protein
MGIFFTDKFSLLHLATGIIAFYWSISFSLWFSIHFAYEIIENSTWGMFLINHVTLWPGGKNKADTVLNQIGDQFYALLGWLIAYSVSLYSI